MNFSPTENIFVIWVCLVLSFTALAMAVGLLFVSIEMAFDRYEPKIEELIARFVLWREKRRKRKEERDAFLRGLERWRSL